MGSKPIGHASVLGASFAGYEVQALIGRGAMGTVYLARDTALNRPVALKVLLGSLARNPVMVRNFHREAQAAAPLRHPGIVRVYSAGIEDGTPYIAMEYVPGETLERFLRRRVRVAWQTALYVGEQVARALACAHAAGIIHRDVKPANILLDQQGRVRLTDFGIANAATQESSHVIGTPQYMSPEQCGGAPLTPAADLFSLGVTLYQMMSGQPPFVADSPAALMTRIATEEPARLNRAFPDIPDDVARLVAHLLQKEPTERPVSAEAVALAASRLQQEEGGRSAIPEALAAYVQEEGKAPTLRLVTPVPAVRHKTVTPNPQRRRRPLLLGIGAFAALAALIGCFFWLGDRQSSHANVLPAIDSAEFQSLPDGATLARVPAPGFLVDELTWSPDGTVVLAEAHGRPDTLAYGASGSLRWT